MWVGTFVWKKNAPLFATNAHKTVCKGKKPSQRIITIVLCLSVKQPSLFVQTYQRGPELSSFNMLLRSELSLYWGDVFEFLKTHLSEILSLYWGDEFSNFRKFVTQKFLFTPKWTKQFHRSPKYLCTQHFTKVWKVTIDYDRGTTNHISSR